jgi:hypothetical protein
MFYTYNQNNSFGTFDVNDDVTYYVIVEADSADDANRRAQNVGIYFDGCSVCRDCSCCGDRWSEAWEGDGDPEPMIYSEPVSTFKTWRAEPGETFAYVYYKDGTKVTVESDA